MTEAKDSEIICRADYTHLWRLPDPLAPRPPWKLLVIVAASLFPGGRARVTVHAPADFVETANTIGLPRYAKQAVDQQFARWVMLHVQSNPLPICTRPRVLIKGKRT